MLVYQKLCLNHFQIAMTRTMFLTKNMCKRVIERQGRMGQSESEDIFVSGIKAKKFMITLQEQVQKSHQETG